jgi:stage V sporulation protein B
MKEGIKLKKNSFIYSTIILIIANFSVRFMGFIYKIFLSRFLGSEGIGLFHLVFHVFLVLVTITSSGIPVAVSKIIAQKKSLNDYKGCRATLSISIFLGLSLSLLLSVLTWINVDYIIKNVVKSYKLYESLFALIPSIPIVTLSSILRSYYYGIKNVKPAAASQVSEQVVRISFVVGVLYLTNPLDLKYSVAIATLGIAIGELGGLILLFAKLEPNRIYTPGYRRDLGASKHENNIVILTKIIIISSPITIARLVSVLMQSANMFLVPRQLQTAGYDAAQSVSAFGEVVGMTLPLLFLPFIVTSALVVNIIPNVSEEKTLKKWSNIKLKSLLALRVSLLISIPIGFLFYFFSRPICTFLYNNSNVGIYLKYLSVTVIFLSLHHIIVGILHGLGKQVITTINYLIGMTIHLVCIYFLVPIPKIAINGFNIGFILSSFLIFVLNFLSLKKHIHIKINIYNHVMKPVFASILMIASIKLFNQLFIGSDISMKLNIVLSTAFGGIIYCLTILITGSIKIKTLQYILFNKNRVARKQDN